MTTTSSPTAHVHRDEVDSATSGPDTWHLEAEECLRVAGRKLEVLGVSDPDAARLAGAVYRFASRVRSDRTGVRP